MDIDTEIATYLAKTLLKKNKIAISQILTDFHINDQQFRESMIRLYFQGRIFGYLDGHFLIFESEKKSMSLEEVLDWPLSEFDLPALISSTQKIVQIANPIALSDENAVIDKEMHSHLSPEVEITRSKETSTVDKITSESRFIFAGNKLNFRLYIKNNSDDKLEGIRVKVDFPRKVLKYLNIRPELEVQLDDKMMWINVGEILPKNTKNITIIFQEMASGKIEVDGFIQYKTPEGFVRFLTMQHTVYEFTIPPILSGLLKAEQIKDFMKQAGIYKNIISYGIPGKLSRRQAQDYLEASLRELGLTSISQIEREESIIHFMSGQIPTPEKEMMDLLVVPQVKEQTMEIYAACKNDQIVSNLLRYASRMLHLYLTSDGHLPTGVSLIDLNCIKCGAVLGRLPPKNEPIQCPFCQTSQIPNK